jgi:hypothetical protein
MLARPAACANTCRRVKKVIMSLIAFSIDLKNTTENIYKTSLVPAFGTPQNLMRHLKILVE